MRFIDYILMAFGNIRRQKLRSALTIFAIVIGATSVTIMLALVTGAKDFFYNQFESSGQLQQVVVTSQEGLDYNEAHGGGGGCNDCTPVNDAMVNKIKEYPHVEAVARVMKPWVFDSVTYDGKKLRMEGVEAADSNGVIKHTFLAGDYFAATESGHKVIITQDYADKMGFKGRYGALIGQQISLTTQGYFTGEGATLPDPVQQFLACQQKEGCDNKNNQNPTTLSATITGVISDQSRLILFPMNWALGLMQDRRWEQTEADKTAYETARQACDNAQSQPSKFSGTKPNNTCNTTVIPHFTLVTTSQLDNKGGGYQSLIVKVDKSSNADAVAVQIRALKVGAVTAQDFIKEQLKMFQIISLLLGAVGGIALAVAAIGVMNTMVMAILERTHEIGVMRAVGAKCSTIRALFTFEAATLGFLGGACGVGVGYILTRIANVVINKQLTSNSVDATNIIGLPVWLALSVIAATTIIGIIAGLYPANRAARLDPVEALRYE